MSPHAPRSGPSGFSLVELLTLVALLGLVLAATAPHFHGSLRRVRAEQATTQLQSDLRWALADARASNRTLRLVFTDAGYLLRDAADSTRVLRRRDWSGDVALAASADPLVFPWGLVQPATLQVQDSTHGTRRWTVAPTGRLDAASAEATP